MSKNVIKDLFTQIKEKIGSSTLDKETVEKFSKKTDELIKMAKALEQNDLLHNLEAQAEFNKRFVEKVIPAGFNTCLDFRELQDVVRKRESSEIRPLLLKPLEEFPRPIPAENAQKIFEAAKVFDEIIILYTDFTGADRELDEQIQKEKDPIALGLLKYTKEGMDGRIFSSRLVFITDWIDEYCDLTLDKLIEEFDIEAYKVTELLQDSVEDSVVADDK